MAASLGSCNMPVVTDHTVHGARPRGRAIEMADDREIRILKNGIKNLVC
jgi:hypothetical protein